MVIFHVFFVLLQGKLADVGTFVYTQIHRLLNGG